MVNIRSYNPALLDDIKAITDIYDHHVAHERASFETEPPSRAEMTARIDSLVTADYPVLIAERDEVVVGYAYAGPHKTRHGHRLTVEGSIYIHHKAMRRGIGSRLLAALITVARTRGYHQMMEVIGDSAKASSIELHRAHGFRHIGTAGEIGFKFGAFLDVFYMQLLPADD